MDYSPWSSKNVIDRNRLKKSMQVGTDVKCMHTNFSGHACPGFRDIATFKNSKISLSDHGLYSPWSSKNLIDRNWLNEFMQVGIDVTCMHTNFGGCPFLVSEILLLSKTAKFPFLTMDYSPWSSKNSIDQNRLKKFMQVVIDVKYMRTNFSGRALPGFGDIATFKNGQISLSDYGL